MAGDCCNTRTDIHMEDTEIQLLVWGVFLLLLLFFIVRYLLMRHFEPIKSSEPVLTVAGTLAGFCYIFANVARVPLCSLHFYVYRVLLVTGCTGWLLLVEVESVLLTVKYHLQRMKASMYSVQDSQPPLHRTRVLLWLEKHSHWLKPRILHAFIVCFLLFWIVMLILLCLLLIPEGSCWHLRANLVLLSFAGLNVLLLAGLAYVLHTVRENLGIRRRIYASMFLILVLVIFFILNPIVPAMSDRWFVTSLYIFVLSAFAYENIIRPRALIRLPAADQTISHSTIVTAAAPAAKLGLERVLADPAGNKAFQQFLIKEFAVENVLFWNACKAFRLVLADNDPGKKAAFLKSVYDTYLSGRAKMEINLTNTVRADTLTRIGVLNGRWDDGLARAASDDALRSAERAIFVLMRANFWDRFKRSAAFKQLETASPL